MPLRDWEASTPSQVCTTSNYRDLLGIQNPPKLLLLAIWIAWIKVVVLQQKQQDEEDRSSCEQNRYEE